MGYILAVLIIVAAIVLRLSYRGATYRPTHYQEVDHIGIVTLARNAFQTNSTRRRVLRNLDDVVGKGWRDLVLDLSRIEPCAEEGSIEPLRAFLESRHRDVAAHLVLVCPSPEVRKSYEIKTLGFDVPVVRTLAEGLALIRGRQQNLEPAHA